MKKSTIVFAGIIAMIFFAIMITCVQLNRAMNETQTASRRSCAEGSMRHVISLSEDNMNYSIPIAVRFPYVAAITRNSSSLWPFACFASVVLFKWIVTSAHCRQPGSSHRVVLFHDFAMNRTYAFPIQYWRIHEKFNSSNPTPRYDIAVARLNLQDYPYHIKPSVFDERPATHAEAGVWKTISTMDKKLYLTNHFEMYNVKIVNAGRCYETYGVEVDDSLICVDTSEYDDCFVHEFGPIYAGDKILGIAAVLPQDCDMKLSIFTNVSYYSNWILRTTYEG